MKRHKLVKACRKGLKQVNVYTAAVLPPVAAGVIALLFVLYGLEWEVGRKLPTEWSSYTPTSLTTALLMVLALGSTAFVTYQGSQGHPTLANGSTVAGIATTAILSWAVQQCNWIGSAAAGVTAAGTIVVIATVVRTVTSGSIERNVTKLRSAEEPRGGTGGIISAMQIGMAIHMGIIVMIALLHDYISPSARPLLLVFAGVGMMAAATVSSEYTPKNYMAIAGMIISLIGSYIQIDQAIVAAGGNSISASEILLATVILAFAPFTILASPKHWIVKTVTMPVLVAVIVFLVVLVTMIPAILIFQGCKTDATAQIQVLAIIGIIAIVAGIAAFFLVLLALIFPKREPQTLLDDDYV